jgi:endonuclease YncB( thermonuclease family)
LHWSDDAPDRYGRQLAFVYLAGSETLVQGELLRQGAALASADVTDKDCATTLLADMRNKAANVRLDIHRRSSLAI